MEGKLFLVATPIGNLGDMTFRAVETLKEVDLIAAEDTRHTRKLLTHFGISTPVTSYFEHNKKVKGQYILNLLSQGKSVALVSDAGMPGISDPGADIVKEAVSAGLLVVPIPGVSASLTALIVSGLPTDRFSFEGFLPREKGPRKKLLEKLSQDERTLIFYEAPTRIVQTLTDLREQLGDRQGAVARELTKKFEEVIRGSLSDLITQYQQNVPRGEFVIVVAGAPELLREIPEADILKAEMDKLVDQGFSKKDAAKNVARHYNLSKRDIYKLNWTNE